MKKLVALTVALVLVSVPVFAQGTPPEKNLQPVKKSMAHPAKGPYKYCPLDKGMMMRGMMPGMMMRMMNSSMVATTDGGVIVLTGDDLIKYDKDLNVVKKVEIKGHMEAMSKMMKECPMMGRGMMNSGTGQAKQSGTSK